VSSVEQYTIYAVGGTAFVNGTAFTNDDSLATQTGVSWLDKILAWPYLTLVLGIAVGVLALPIVTSIVRAVRARARRAARPPQAQQRRGGGRRVLGRSPARQTVSIDGRHLQLLRMLEVQAQPPSTDWACEWSRGGACAGRCWRDCGG
jgi:hypothetical protein